MNAILGLKVKLATALACHTNNQKMINCRLTGDCDLESLLTQLDELFPGFQGHRLSGATGYC